MIDGAIFDNLASGLMSGGAAITVCIILLRRNLQDLTEQIKRLEAERKECAAKCEARFVEGERRFARLDREILSGLNELKIAIARMEGERKGQNNLAGELLAEFRKPP